MKEYSGLYPVLFRSIYARCCILVCLLGSCFLPSLSHSARIHSICLGSFETAAQADLFLHENNMDKGSLYCLHCDDPIYSYVLLYGYYDTTAEAWAMLQTSFDSAKGLYSWEWDGRPLVKTDPLLDTKRIAKESFSLPLTMPEFWASLIPQKAKEMIDNGYNPESDSLSELGYEQLLSIGFYSKDKTRSSEALLSCLETNNDSPESIAIRLYLARSYMTLKKFDNAKALIEDVSQCSEDLERSAAQLLGGYLLYYQGDIDSAYHQFISCVSDVSCPSLICYDALRMAAGCAHKNKDYASSILAYISLERSQAPESVRHEAHMQRCGLMFELVSRGIGDWDEVRRELNRVESYCSLSQTNATARLMFVETYFNERNYTRAQQEAIRLILDYPDISREYICALYWLARSQQKLGQIELAIDSFKDVLTETQSKPDVVFFPAFNVNLKSLRMLNRIFAHRGDIASSLVFEQTLISQAPKSSEAKDLQDK